MRQCRGRLERRKINRLTCGTALKCCHAAEALNHHRRRRTIYLVIAVAYSYREANATIGDWLHNRPVPQSEGRTEVPVEAWGRAWFCCWGPYDSPAQPHHNALLHPKGKPPSPIPCLVIAMQCLLPGPGHQDRCLLPDSQRYANLSIGCFSNPAPSRQEGRQPSALPVPEMELEYKVCGSLSRCDQIDLLDSPDHIDNLLP